MERGNRRRFFRQSIELPIAMEVEGSPAAVYGVLLNISEAGCRLRSLILIERDRSVSFGLKRCERAPLMLRGRIVARETPSAGGGYEYGISFSVLNDRRCERLRREICELQRREGAARAGRRPPSTMSPVKMRQRRYSVRALAAFPVRYRQANRAAQLCEANDISAGGLRLVTREVLALGSIVELRFKLPNDYLDMYPPARERAEISPFGLREVRLPDNRRPFEEMLVHGRVVSHFGPAHGREAFGIAFTDIDGYQREEIARFTHAAQLAKLRMG
jgi:c-di-GMP-binding flagellar brake protein YcgR